MSRLDQLPPVASPAFEIAGRYEYDHGDHLRYRCGPHRFCDMMLVRDARIQRLAPGQHIRVVVRRAPCKSTDGDSILHACLFSSSSSAFAIERWL